MLRERARAFMNELGVSVQAFCRRVGIGPTTYYAWQHGRELSASTLERMESYLDKYNF